MDEEEREPVGPETRPGGEEGGEAGSPRPAGHDEAQQPRLCPGRNRTLQSARRGRRKLFGRKLRRKFLEYFAATANVAWSARRAGIAYQTVWKHRMKDENFAEDYDRALEQGTARVRAKLIETKAKAKPIETGGDVDAPELEEIDPQIGLAILREHGWGVSGRSPLGRPRKIGRAPRAATNAEVRAALTKRLRIYARRMRETGREPPPWLPPVENKPKPPPDEEREGREREGREG